MEKKQIDQLIMMHSSKLSPEYIEPIRERLVNMDYTQAVILLGDLKDTTLVLILSILVGQLGIDRFFIGDIGMGVGKLVTFGGCGIWWLVDLCFIMDATRKRNSEKLLQSLSMYSDY